MIVNLLIAFGNAISLSASILIVSAHSLIAFWKAIRLSARIFIASTLPSDIACSPTVPGGDTPCLTAGDARRANPWIDNITNLRHRRCRTEAHFCTSELPPPRFQCDAAGIGIRVVCLPTGSPSLCSGITRGYAWCASAGGVTLCGCGCGRYSVLLRPNQRREWLFSAYFF